MDPLIEEHLICSGLNIDKELSDPRQHYQDALEALRRLGKGVEAEWMPLPNDRSAVM